MIHCLKMTNMSCLHLASILRVLDRKWKYLDTVTIDVEILPTLNASNSDEDVLRVGVLGEERTIVDMTRFVHLPTSQLFRLEADREETRSEIAAVGFDPTY